MGRVLSRVRHLVAAFALAAASAVLVQPTAQAACTCEPNTSLRAQARSADVVFQGFLSDRQDTRRQRTFTLDVEQVYQGTITESPVEVVTNARSECGLGKLRTERSYVVFATSRSNGALTSAQCTGTGPATPKTIERVEQVLGPGEPFGARVDPHGVAHAHAATSGRPSGRTGPVACISTSSSRSGYAPAALRTRTSRSARPRRLHNVTVHEPFELVVARHGGTVLRVCRAVLGPVDADDAWSATFLSALVAYPEKASIELSVYGNKLASQHMNVQWEIRGSGPVLIQTGSRDAELEEQLQNGGFIKRMLREVLPFGGVYIK